MQPQGPTDDGDRHQDAHGQDSSGGGGTSLSSLPVVARKSDHFLCFFVKSTVKTVDSFLCASLTKC